MLIDKFGFNQHMKQIVPNRVSLDRFLWYTIFDYLSHGHRAKISSDWLKSRKYTQDTQIHFTLIWQ